MALSASALFRGVVARLIGNMPTSIDSVDDDRPIRLNHNRELVLGSVAPTLHQLADEGSFLVAANPTTGTGVTWVAAQTAFSDTQPNFYIYNGQPVGGRSIALVYLKLITMQAATATTAIHYAVITDSTDRALTTDNTTLVQPVCPRTGLGAPIPFAGVAGAGGSRVHFQSSATVSAIAASSAQNRRRVARGCVGGLNIIGDEIQINFGSIDAGAQTATTAVEGAGQPGRRVTCDAPIIIDPGHSACIHIWLTTSSASINPEFMLGLAVR